MTAFEGALTFVATRAVPGSPTERSEIAQTAADASVGATWKGQLRELGSLVGLGLRLRARGATDDDAWEIVKQASVLGGSLALLGGAGWASAVVPAHAWPSVLGILAMVAAALFQQPWIRATLCLAVATGWPVFVDIDNSVILAAALIAGAGSVLSRHTRNRPPRWPTAIALAGLMTAHGLALVTSIDALSPTAIVGIAAAGPVLLLILGWFDPRYAVAGTVVWSWRLLATDSGELAAGAKQLVTALTVDEVVVRCFIMASGVIFGAFVSRQAVSRSVRI